MTPTADLAAHVQALADAFNVALDVRAMSPDEAVAIPILRVVQVAPVTDETTYAVALHELGHVLSPMGHLGPEHMSQETRRAGRPASLRDWNLKVDVEVAAWEWAEHHALVWTPLMERVREMTLDTYRAAREQYCRKLEAALRPAVKTHPARSFARTIQWHS